LASDARHLPNEDPDPHRRACRHRRDAFPSAPRCAHQRLDAPPSERAEPDGHARSSASIAPRTAARHNSDAYPGVRAIADRSRRSDAPVQQKVSAHRRRSPALVPQPSAFLAL